MATPGSFGRYRLQGVLGHGGMGQVFRAYDTTTGRVVALKVLPQHLAEDREFQERFRREARTAASLNDPNIVPIHGYGEINGQLYVDMRLIEGRDLVTYIAEKGGRLSPSQAVAVVEQVAGALDSAHRAGLVHRDVKPSNILVAAARDFVYLIDFGIARTATDTALTHSGETMGTLDYMAPERFWGTTDLRADVYSLACVLYECLTGRRPYPGSTIEDQLRGHLDTPPPRPSTMAPGIPPAFDEVIARGMAKNPAQRYQSAPELAHAARAALDSAPMPSGPAPRTPGRRTPPRPDAAVAAKRRSALVITGLVAGPSVVVVAVVALVAALTTHHDNAAPSTGSSTSTATAGSTAPASRVPPLPPFNPPSDLGANCQYPPAPSPDSKPAKPPRSGKVPTTPVEVNVNMVTDQGDISLSLDNGKSPCTVNSFLSLAQQGFFDGTQCLRLTTSPTLGTLQCGAPNSDGTGGPGYHFNDEYPTNQYESGDPALHQPVLYPRGTLAMWNTEPNTNGSQFFLVYRDSQLPPQYTVFGRIDPTGLTTIDNVAKAGVVGGREDGIAVTPVKIKSVRME
ncbi:protein kinase [Mycobacterium sp. 852002-51163_SCH5372311]|uniref:protein kinase domain-containing protein n=1 Tax=Mycobacterium sp. 852002-51163_SCH5372311 TaxID=1834097 RepID=UPI0008017201|nr:protein kinase [Mycobacterium sp. 852002-51163_SCH5372311]